MLMKIIFQLVRVVALIVVALSSRAVSTQAQLVFIPDPNLTAAIREALHKPDGTLSEQDLLSLTELAAGFRSITNLQGLEAARNLTTLDLSFNGLTSVQFPATLVRLSFVDLTANNLNHLVLPAGLTNLSSLFLDQNQLKSIILPEGLSRLSLLRLCCNPLTSFHFPPGLTNLALVELGQNLLTNVSFSSDLGNLTELDLQGNQIVSLTLPTGANRLRQLQIIDNPLATVVLPERLAATNLAGTVASLQHGGVSIFTYPEVPELVRPRMFIGAFKIGITGPPGVYSVLGSTNLTSWKVLGSASNPLGSVNFSDPVGNSFPKRFYRVLLQAPPSNMVFVAPSTFKMGSPASEEDRSPFEGPQATVTLTRGFWIGKYEVTQGEYLSVMGENPSDFPGDLSRPVSSVTWLDATNYCWRLTQRELAAGRISAGSQFRLPTEAEWECAARAGTSTRFSYGDDVGYASLTNYAWLLLNNNDLSVHAVGQKLPNPWGLYDMAGNVWEWCQDWYGEQLGGVQTDPTGPGPNSQAEKVMRGGAYDYPNSSCRSASRLFRTTILPDSDLGFRVVLTTLP
jgi:formylglycine-generating enzyme required for sulfatase activity